MDIDKLAKENPLLKIMTGSSFHLETYGLGVMIVSSLFLRDGWHSMPEEAPLIDCKARQEINIMNKAFK